MENKERAQTKTAPEIMLPRSQEPETKKLLDIVAEQAAIMGRGETREMLAFIPPASSPSEHPGRRKAAGG